MFFRRVLLIFIFLAVCATAPAFGDLTAGFSQRALSIPMGTPTAGSLDLARVLAGETGTWTDNFPPTRRIYYPPKVKCLALTNGDGALTHCRVDTQWVSDYMVTRIIENLDEATGGSHEGRFILSATNTFSGPGRFTAQLLLAMQQDSYLQEMFDKIVSNIASCAADAEAALVPARIGVAFNPRTTEGADGVFILPGHEQIHEASRKQSEEITAGMTPDHRLTVVRIEGTDSTPIAALLFFTVSGNVLSPELVALSGDVAAAIEFSFEDYFRKKTDTHVDALFVQGPCGDVGPARDATGHENYALADKIGKMITPLIYSLYDRIRPKDMDDDPTIMTVEKRIALSMADIYENDGTFNNPDGTVFDYGHGAFACGWDDVAEAGKDENGCVPLPNPDTFFSGLARNDSQINPYLATGFSRLVDECAPVQSMAPDSVRLMAGRIGNLTFYSVPGSAATRWDKHLREILTRRFGFNDDYILSFGQTQDHGGFILEPDDYELGGYEAGMSFWGRLFGPYIQHHIADLADQVQNGLREADNEKYDPGMGMVDVDYKPTLALSSPGTPAAAIQPVAVADRMTTVSFSWTGGDPTLGTPEVILQVNLNENWVDRELVPGKIQTSDSGNFILEFSRDDRCDFFWTVDYEIPPDEALGNYRFAVSGNYRQDNQTKSYLIYSTAFKVEAAPMVLVRDLLVVDDMLTAGLYWAPRDEHALACLQAGTPIDQPAPTYGGSAVFTIYSEQDIDTVTGQYNSHTGLVQAAYEFSPDIDYTVYVADGDGLDDFQNRSCGMTYPIYVQGGEPSMDPAVTPEAQITFPIAGVEVEQGGTVTFSAKASSDVLTFLWSFADGSYGCGPTVTHRFQKPGEFDVALTVSNGHELSDGDSLLVRVISLEKFSADNPICPMYQAENDCPNDDFGSGGGDVCGGCNTGNETRGAAFFFWMSILGGLYGAFRLWKIIEIILKR